MRIPLWIDLRDAGADPAMLAVATHADAVLVSPGDAVQMPGAIVAADGRLLRDGRVVGSIVTVAGAEGQDAAAAAEGVVLVETTDWTIIPLENLIAARRDRPGTLYALARSPQEAGVLRDTLETGVHGIVLVPRSPEDVALADAILRSKGVPGDVDQEATGVGQAAMGVDPETTGVDAPATARQQQTRAHIVLEPATVTAIDDAGPGDRVCVDATSVFSAGEGLLVGSTARSFVLVHAETIESEYVRARPFRVNAGAVHSYVMATGGRTRYLSELAAGAQVLAVDAKGGTRALTVGRAKIERRPHLLVRWRDATREGPADATREGSAVLQNAETIRLVRPDGTAVSVTDLRPGDEVLVHHEAAARHFGMPVDAGLEER